MRWTMVDKMNEKDHGLKEIKWNMINEVQSEGNVIRHEQWSVDWRKWNEAWTIKSIM